MLETPYVGDLNKAITRGEINDIIMVSEAEQEKKISMIAQEIAQRYHEDGVRIVLISGPSSSGKPPLRSVFTPNSAPVSSSLTVSLSTIIL